MGQKRVIRTASGTVGLAAYVAAWKRVIAAPANATFRSSLRSYFGSFSPAEIRREYFDGVQDRINRHIPGYGQGRKWDDTWQNETWRAARDLNRPRLRLYSLPSWLKSRFAHRICTYED